MSELPKPSSSLPGLPRPSGILPPAPVPPAGEQTSGDGTELPAPIPGTGGMRFAPRVMPTLRPRKVRMGVRLSSKTGPVASAWSGQRVMRLVEDNAPGAALGEGVEYARLGQTRSLLTTPGHINARVQGRMPNAYVVDIRMPVYGHEQWEQVIGAMLTEARPLASLLAGEVPANIEDLFVPLRLRLFPQEASDVSLACTCADFKSGSTWCKHVCCVMALMAERLSEDPFGMFALRGISKDDLLERLRQRRAVDTARAAQGASDRPIPAYLPALPGVSDVQAQSLDQSPEQFWSAPIGLDELDLPMSEPPISHALLRRLGTSPFDGAKFPLVGLLATCYDVISADALKRERDEELDRTPSESGSESAES